MTTSTSNLDRTAWYLLAACLGAVQIKLSVAQTLFGIAALLWLATLRHRPRPPMPSFLLPLVVYIALTLVSTVFSRDPLASFVDDKQLLLFLMVPMVATLATGPRAQRTMDVVIAFGAAGALVGIVQFAMFGYSDLDNRPVGALSHYMTYSGVLMLVTCAAFARLLFFRREWIWPAIAVPALLVALAVTLTRNAWIGTVLGVGTLIAVRRPRLLWLVPIVVVAGFAIAPQGIRDRALSTFDMNNPTNRDRFAMMEIGRRIVQEHPLFGVGPEQIEDVYADYRPDYAVNPTNPHLHNVPIQIAAERGLPALAAWLWFVVIAGRDLFRQLRRGQAPAVAGAGLAALVAMLGAGWFEYNFGDSEFLMLFLGLLTLPHAAAHSRADRRHPEPADR
jgi:O-antigen ligase